MCAGVLFAAWGSLGDLHPSLAIAAELRRRGHRPAIATLSLHREAVDRAGFDFFPLRPQPPADPQAVRQLVTRLFGAGGPAYAWTRLVLPALRDAYDDLMAAAQAMTDCRLLVAHPLTPAVRLVAERLGLPWLASVLQPAGLVSAHDLPAVPPLVGLHPLLARHPGLARLVIRLGRLTMRGWGRRVDAVRRDVGLPARGENPAIEGYMSPHGVLAMFPEILCPPQPDHPPNTVWTGFPLYRGDAATLPGELSDFLDAGQPPILFTLGSSAVWTAGDFHRNAVLAARKLGRRALLLTGGQPVGVPLPASMMAVPYAPHALVMPRAALVVHHGGIGTAAQALLAGKPQLIVPFGMDQPDNARRCRALGVAGVLPRSRATPDRLAGALARVLDDPAPGLRATELGERLRRVDGAAAAADVIAARLPPQS